MDQSGLLSKAMLSNNRLFVKRLESEQALIEHAKLFAKGLTADGVPISSRNRHTVVCSTIFAYARKSLTESRHIATGRQLIDLVKQLDQFQQLSVRVGSMVAIINMQMQGDSVELWGFTTPKTVTRITRDPTDNSIKQFEFNNDPNDVWPRVENAEYADSFLMYSAFFGDKQSAEQALMMIMLQSSGELDIRNHIIENKITVKENNMDQSGLVPKAGVNRGPGSPYSKGSGDAWYHRGFNPQYHKYVKGTPEYSEYSEGYNDMWEMEAKFPGGGKQYDEAKEPKSQKPTSAAKDTGKVSSTQIDLKAELDPVSQELIAMARAKYPNAKSDLGAVVKLMQRSMIHGKESDSAQDRTLKQMQRRIDDLERTVQDLQQQISRMPPSDAI